MRIGMVLEGVFPPDIRVEKESRRLIDCGHEVFLLSAWKEGLLKEDKIDGVQITRIVADYSLINKIFMDLIFRISFVNPFWKNHIGTFIKNNKIDVLHIHDLPLVKTALMIAEKNSIPIIADLHENYPEAIRQWRSGPRSPLTLNTLYEKVVEFLQSPSRFDRMARSILPRVSHIIAVVDEGKFFYSSQYGIPENKISVIMNTEDTDYFDTIPIQKTLVEKFKDNFVISYVGGFGPHRGIDTAIRMMPSVIKTIPHAKLLLIGGKGNPSFEKTMRDLCVELNLENNVEFTGWVDFSLVPTYIAASSVCLIPHHASGHTDSTIPHKLFQYMAMKKPIVTTDCIPLKRIVEETSSGIVVPSGDAGAMAKAIIDIYNNPNLARQYGENGRKAVETKYNWKNDSENLIQIYQELSK